MVSRSGIKLSWVDHHQQQTQQTFHVQLLRLAYPDGSSVPGARCSQLRCVKSEDNYTRRIPIGWRAQRVASNRTRTGGRRGGGALLASCQEPGHSHGGGRRRTKAGVAQL